MKAPCKNPCKECPFRKESLAGWLGGGYESPEQFIGLVNSETPFPCHMTMGEPHEHVEEADMKLCKGAIMYMRKVCKLPRDKSLSSYVKEVSISDTENILDRNEFLSHHRMASKRQHP